MVNLCALVYGVHVSCVGRFTQLETGPCFFGAAEIKNSHDMNVGYDVMPDLLVSIDQCRGFAPMTLDCCRMFLLAHAVVDV